MSDLPVLSVRHLSKSYPLPQKQTFQALYDISLDVQEGEFLVLLGPSGSGKSTLLQILAGLETATSGEILLAGQDIRPLPPGDRNMSMVFQNYILYPHMSVYENLAYPLRAHKISKNIIHTRIEEVSSILDIETLLTRRPSQLSGGQKQRIAIARAMVKKPKIYLFDEPLSNLDSRLKDKMRREIKALQMTLGTTMIYVTHDQLEAMSLGTRIVVLNKGKIEQIGPPEEVYAKPRSLFVADFLGNPPINLLNIQKKNGHLCLKNGTDLGISHLPILSNDEEEWVIGIRPEHIYPIAEDSSFLPLQMIPNLKENLGHYSICYLQMGNEEVVMSTQISTHIEIGKPTQFYIDPVRILVYSKKSELLLGYFNDFC